MRFLPIFCFIFFLCIACNNNSNIQVDLKLDYYPLETGHSVSYQVDSILFSNIALPNVLIDTISFQIKEVIGDTFLDNTGSVNYNIERYKRSDENSPWLFEKLWFATLVNSKLQKVEDNLRFVKLSFPPEVTETWNGNSFILSNDRFEYLQGWEYSYTEVDVPFSINGFSFDSTLVVTQINEENLISKKYAIEHYSRKIGLVFKEMMILEKQNINNGWDKPEKGVIVRYSIIDFSN